MTSRILLEYTIKSTLIFPIAVLAFLAPEFIAPTVIFLILMFVIMRFRFAKKGGE